jgi:hypothetical protein
MSKRKDSDPIRLFHRIFGIFIVILFLLTGQYMHHYHNHLAGMDDGMRMLYRTRHIFILFSGLLNLGIGTYFHSHQQVWRRIPQLTGSGLIVIASLLFVVAFFYEPGLANLDTPLSHWGAIAILAGTLCHLFSGAWQRRGEN